MGDNIRTVQEEHRFNEVVDQRRDEHGLQLDVRILEDVGEGALRAVVRQNDDAVGLDAGADETENDLQIKVLKGEKDGMGGPLDLTCLLMLSCLISRICFISFITDRGMSFFFS